MQMADAKVKVANRLGLHARPAMTFVDLASGFNSTVTVAKGSQKVDGKSIMQLMMLAATQGTELHIIAEGQDAEQAVVALKELIENKCEDE